MADQGGQKKGGSKKLRRSKGTKRPTQGWTILGRHGIRYRGAKAGKNKTYLPVGHPDRTHDRRPR